MTLPFLILALVTVAGAVAAMTMRNLVHCALSLVVTFAGLAGLYLQLSAEFVGFVQILVYIGAVAILIVFAILLTRGTEPVPPAPVANAPVGGIAIGVAVMGVISFATLDSVFVRPAAPQVVTEFGAPTFLHIIVEASKPTLPVRALGEKLMTEYVLPLEVIGLLLTAALIGAVIIAMPEKRQ